MKKFAVALAILMFLMIVACGGHGANRAEGAPKQTEYATFSLLDYDGGEGVLRHKETGVCYLVVYQQNNAVAGVTLMVNPDGTPYVWED